ncbi:DUF3857 domain-containing protein [Chryseobacterium sp. JK1]|uniref:transglutaminase domain-containing protein n=1 Tax=Chryseobacterium sp. JK1 TaxID=874294 RepID=UPI003D699091
MKKILISAVYLLSVGVFAQSKDHSKTWELLLNNKREEARAFYDKTLQSQKLKNFETLFLDALIDQEMGKFIFDETFVKNFINTTDEEAYLFPIIQEKSMLGDIKKNGIDAHTYKKVDILYNSKSFGHLNSIVELKTYFDYLRSNFSGSAEAHSKLGKIDKWQYAGVFENLNGSGLDIEYEPETYAKNDKLFNTGNFGNIGWYNKKHNDNDGFTFFINELEYGRGIIYAQTFINNPIERKVWLDIGANNELKVFLNDVEILSSTKEGYTSTGSHLVEVTLPKGMNRLLLKNDSKTSNMAGFIVVPYDTNYQKINDLTYFDTYHDYKKSTLAELQPKELELQFEQKLKEKIAAHKGDFIYEYLLVLGYLNNQQNDKAKEKLDAFAQKYPKSSLIQTLLGVYYSNIEDDEKLNEIYKNIEVNDSQYYQVPVMKIVDSEVTKNMNIQELEKYKAILTKSKAKAMEELFDVIISARNHDLEKMKKHLSNIKNDFANNEKFFVNLTYLEEADKKDQSGIIKKLEDFLATTNNMEVMYSLLDYYEKSNKIEEEKKLLKKFIEIYPSVNVLRNKYISLLQDNLSDPEIMKQINEGLANFPYSYSLLALKAEILALQKNKTEAIKYAKESISHYADERMYKLIKDLDQTEDEIDMVAVKDLKKLALERRNKGEKGKKGVTTLLDEYIVNVYPEGGFKKRITYAYEITSESGIEEMKEYYINYYDNVLKSEIVKPNGNIVPGEKSEDQIVFTNLERGDIILIQKESIERRGGRFYKDFNLSSYFNSEYPVMESVFTVITPEDVSYQVKGNNGEVPSVKKKIGNKQSQTWRLSNLPEVNLDENYGPTYYDSTISVTANSIKTWQEISNWYIDLTKKSLVSDRVVENAFKEIFPTGISGINDTEKAERIYNYIEKNVTYSSVDFRQSGFIPQKPSKTLVTKLGDCKDLSTLFVILGNQAGLKSNLVLVQTNDNSTQRLILPNLSFNHCIVKVNLDGKETFLEMTDKYLPFNAIVKGNYKAKALVIPSAQLIDISSDYNTKSLFKTISEVQINGDDQNFVTKQYTMGETKSYYNSFFQDSQSEDNRKKKMEKELGSILDKIINVKSVKAMSGKDLTSNPLAYEVQFNINDKPQSVGSLKIMKIPFITKPFTKDIIATEKRNTDIQYTQYEKQNEYAEEIYLNIPANMKFIEIPENKNLAYNDFTYSIVYELEKNNRLKITRKSKTPWDDIKKEQYPEFKKFVEDAISAEDQILGYK